MGRRGIHVGHDQRAHRAARDYCAGGSPPSPVPLAPSIPVPASPEQPVAVFDSGVGGLTVLHELLVSLPTEDYLYLGDTARFPYGNRTEQELQAFAIEIAEHLLRSGAKLLVIACNSASAVALEAVERHVSGAVDVIGVLRPAAQIAVVASHTGRIGLL